MPTPEYLLDLINLFEARADAKNAIQMKKYMKDHFEFFGITSPERKEIYRIHWKNHGYRLSDKTEEIVKWCWLAPQREYQYFAMELLGKQAKIANRGFIDLYSYIILNKSWWDTVDYIASNLVGVHFIKYPDQIETVTNEWMNSGNMWLQRTCLLFQLKYKSETYTSLLESFIKPLTESKEFFIRKAIGWALREYSKTDPNYVLQYVKNHHLSGLSEREALKWMKHKSLIQ